MCLKNFLRMDFNLNGYINLLKLNPVKHEAASTKNKFNQVVL